MRCLGVGGPSGLLGRFVLHGWDRIAEWPAPNGHPDGMADHFAEVGDSGADELPNGLAL